MTLLLRKQNAQDGIEGREHFGWKDHDFAVLDDETVIGRIYCEQVAGGREVVLVSAGDMPPRTAASLTASMKPRRRSPKSTGSAQDSN
jgi:hypothetical protein